MNLHSYNRREFLTRAVVSGTGAALAMSSVSWAAEGAGRKKVKLGTPNAEKLGWRISCQVYTFRDRTFYESLDVLAGMGVRLVEPGFFLPLAKEHPGLTTSEKLSPEMRKEMKQRMDDLGMKMPSFYAGIEGDKNAYRKIFDLDRKSVV